MGLALRGWPPCRFGVGPMDRFEKRMKLKSNDTSREVVAA